MVNTLITRANVTATVLGFRPYRKRTTTMLARMPGAFTCETRDGNRASCNDGYVALDAEGYPYPVARTIAEKTYERVQP